MYARGTHLEEKFLDEISRPRTVQDCIPQSRLAQYSNYEYNESRELSYAPNTTEVSFHYPCLYQKNSTNEPWMMPEVEQLFIWLAYSSQYELSNPKCLGDLEDLKHLDETCSCADLHKINPIFYETFEKAPGKARYTQLRRFKRDDLAISTFVRVKDFDEMNLKIYLRQGNTKLYKPMQRV